MSDLLSDFAQRIKEGGAFGPSTTLDNPDKYAGDALVQIATTASASDHELWEAVEYMYNMLDYRQAEGRYLERLHGIPKLGLTKEPLESWDAYRAKVLGFLSGNASRTDPSVLAAAQPGVLCARQIFSTLSNPVEGIPAGGTMLVLKTCNTDYEELAAQLYDKTEIGIYSWYGDVTANHQTENNGCLQFRFQPASKVYIDLTIHGYFVDTNCRGAVNETSVRAEAVERLSSVFDDCGFGQQLTGAEMTALLAGLQGFVCTAVGMKRRPKRLYSEGCDLSDALTLEECGQNIPWASYVACGSFAVGEMWCNITQNCVQLKPWEYPDFDISLARIVVSEPEAC